MYWKFICKKETEAECFQRRLFGDTERMWESVKEVKKGDTLFLYNIETDVLFGPFTASCDGGYNVEPEAWGGRFPAQVRVNWNVIGVITKASEELSFLREKRFRLKEEEAMQVLQKLIVKQIEAIPPSLREGLQRLDEEIHSIAHRIEEVITSSKLHPADREVELDRLKGEFISKMRDFVWAVRRLDKYTKILDLPSNR